MSIPIQTDNSIQLSYSNFGFTITNVDNYATSNQLIISSNQIINKFNTDITGINTNLSTNYYNKTSTDTALALKQNTLTAATNLLGVGSAITALDYNKISLNKPNYFPIDPSIYYNKSETNTLITNTSNYVTNTSNILQNNINTTNNNISTNYFPKLGGSIIGDTSVNANLTTQQLYINSTTSTASIFLNPVSTNYSILKAKTPWAMYFAEDYNSSSPTVLPNYINNGRDAVLGGTAVSKLTQSGNGASGAITYIQGTTGSTLVFPTGSIPSVYTILSLTRYTGATTATRLRILQSTTNNWLHGHWAGNRGVAFYVGWKTSAASTGTQTDWLCCIGKNSGGTAGGNILVDGVAKGTDIGGTGNLTLTINTGTYGISEGSDWGLSCVMIWDTELTDTEMLELNAIINTYKTTGVSIKSLIVDDTIIESRNYNGEEKTELLLFKGNDIAGTNGEDRIRLKAGSIAFDTYTELTPANNRGNENIVMFINGNGNVGIGTTTNLTYKLNINGSLNSTSLYQNGTLIDFNSYLPKAGGEITGTLSFGTRIQDYLIYLYGTGTGYGFGINNDTLRYNTGLNGTHKFYSNGTLTASISKTGLITAAGGFSGSGSSLTDIPYANITGQPTNFQSDWLTTIINKPSIYTQTETNNLLTAKEAVLTFSSPLTRTTNTIGINLGSYSTTGNDVNYLLKTGGAMSGEISGVTTLTATTINSTILSTTNNGNVVAPTKGINGGNGDRLVLWPGNSIVYPYSLGIDNSTLWYSVPNGASHKFYHNGSLITTISSTGLSTTGTISGTTFSGSGSSLTDIPYANITGKPDLTNIYTKTETDGRYLQLIGGLITGDLSLNKINPAIQLGATNGNNWAVAGANGYYSESALTGDMVLRSLQKLHLQTGGAKSAMTISTNNNIGIGTDTEYSTATKLIIKGTSAGASQPIVRIEQLAPWNGGTKNYAFQVSGYSDLGGIRINGTDTFNTIFTTGDNDMGLSTNAGVIKFLTNGTEKMRILNNGNIGIGTNDSSSKLTVEGRTITGNGSSTYSSIFSGNTVGLTVANAAGTGNPEQLVICDTSNANTALLIGSKYNAGNAFSVIQSIVAGAGYKTLSLNPNGGNIGIGTTNPNNILQVGDGARLRISNGANDYSVIGTKDVDDNTNTRIVISGNTRGSYEGQIQYLATAGSHIFYTNAITERMRIANNGNISCTNDFTAAGPITSTSTTPSVFSFINIAHPTRTTHIPFSDNNIYLRAPVKIDFDNLSFGSRVQDFLIYLYGSDYGFGINGGTLRYNSGGGNHAFYTAGAFKVNINSTGIGIGIFDPFAPLCIGNPSVASDGHLVVSKNSGGNRNFRMGYDGSFNFCFGDYGNATSGNTWRSTDLSIGYSSGNVGIGTTPSYKRLEVNGDTNCTGSFGITGDLSLYRGSGGVLGNLNCGGYITCLLYVIDNSGTDYVGVGNASGNNISLVRMLYIMYATFTGVHRCFTNDELFDIENPQNFKNNYIGRIVVSTGKIATDLKGIDNDNWEIKYDKEGITIEDALPQIELSRKKKDKRVFGVMGSAKRGNSREERLIINSVGEGAIWVCNSNGNIENGDYITSSDYLGYGEKQDDDLLHNYTVAKATMDCDFELDSPLYNCIEIDDLDANGNKLRIAFIACSYHCG